MSAWRRAQLALGIVWALPWTLFGLSWGLVGLATGGGIQRRGRVIEFWGGVIPAAMRKLLFARQAAAITFGNVVLAVTREELDRTRRHEFVHVRQYERWGPFFVPAYLACSAYLWARKRNAYHENPFEVEAYAIDDLATESDQGRVQTGS